MRKDGIILLVQASVKVRYSGLENPRRGLLVQTLPGFYFLSDICEVKAISILMYIFAGLVIAAGAVVIYWRLKSLPPVDANAGRKLAKPIAATKNRGTSRSDSDLTCSNCGKILDSGAGLCSGCGSEIYSAPGE